MPTLKNSASINLNPSLSRNVQVSNKEEKPMRFQYVCDKDMKNSMKLQFFISRLGPFCFREKRSVAKKTLKSTGTLHRIGNPVQTGAGRRLRSERHRRASAGGGFGPRSPLGC